MSSQTKTRRPARIRHGLGLKQPEFARLTGYSIRAVAGWESGKPLGPSARQRVAEADRLQQALACVMPPGTIGQWLIMPNDAFEGQTPLQLIERGQVDRLWRMIYQLESGSAT